MKDFIKDLKEAIHRDDLPLQSYNKNLFYMEPNRIIDSELIKKHLQAYPGKENAIEAYAFHCGYGCGFRDAFYIVRVFSRDENLLFNALREFKNKYGDF